MWRSVWRFPSTEQNRTEQNKTEQKKCVIERFKTSVEFAWFVEDQDMTYTERGFLWLSLIWEIGRCSIVHIDWSLMLLIFLRQTGISLKLSKFWWIGLICWQARASGDIDWHWTLLDIGHCPLTLEMDFVRFCELSYCWLSFAVDGMEEERPSNVFLQKVKHVLISKMGERLEDHTEWKFPWEDPSSFSFLKDTCKL